MSVSSVDFLVTEHARMGSSSTPRMRFGTPSMAERDARRARSATPFRAANSAMWSERGSGGDTEDAARALLQSWQQQTVAPTPPFPAFRKTGGARFKHVPARYSGPVAQWQMGESCHSRRKRDLDSSPTPGGRAPGVTQALWEDGPITPKEGAKLRSDTRRSAGARRPDPPPPLTKEAMDKFRARQAAREGGVPEYNHRTFAFAAAVANEIDVEHDRQQGLVAPSAAAAGLHYILRTVVAENDSDGEADEDDDGENASAQGDVDGTKAPGKFTDSLKDGEGNRYEPKESERLALKLSLEQWRKEVEMEIEQFPSIVLYCEHKLRETFAVPVKQEPDPFRIAVVCSLHEKLTGVCGRYSQVLQVLHTEMMKAIYSDLGDQGTGGAAAASGKPQQRQQQKKKSDPGDLTPYFLRTQKLAQENFSMAYDLKAFGDMHGFLEAQAAQRDFAVNFTHRIAAKKALGHWFCRWKLITQHTKKFNSIVDAAAGRSKKGLSLIFRAWKDHMFRMSIKNLKTYISTSVGWEDNKNTDPEDEAMVQRQNTRSRTSK